MGRGQRARQLRTCTVGHLDNVAGGDRQNDVDELTLTTSRSLDLRRQLVFSAKRPRTILGVSIEIE